MASTNAVHGIEANPWSTIPDEIRTFIYNRLAPNDIRALARTSTAMVVDIDPFRAPIIMKNHIIVHLLIPSNQKTIAAHQQYQWPIGSITKSTASEVEKIESGTNYYLGFVPGDAAVKEWLGSPANRNRDGKSYLEMAKKMGFDVLVSNLYGANADYYDTEPDGHLPSILEKLKVRHQNLITMESHILEHVEPMPADTCMGRIFKPPDAFRAGTRPTCSPTKIRWPVGSITKSTIVKVAQALNEFVLGDAAVKNWVEIIPEMATTDPALTNVTSAKSYLELAKELGFNIVVSNLYGAIADYDTAKEDINWMQQTGHYDPFGHGEALTNQRNSEPQLMRIPGLGVYPETCTRLDIIAFQQIQARRILWANNMTPVQRRSLHSELLAKLTYNRTQNAPEYILALLSWWLDN